MNTFPISGGLLQRKEKGLLSNLSDVFYVGTFLKIESVSHVPDAALLVREPIFKDRPTEFISRGEPCVRPLHIRPGRY